MTKYIHKIPEILISYLLDFQECLQRYRSAPWQTAVWQFRYPSDFKGTYFYRKAWPPNVSLSPLLCLYCAATAGLAAAMCIQYNVLLHFKGLLFSAGSREQVYYSILRAPHQLFSGTKILKAHYFLWRQTWHPQIRGQICLQIPFSSFISVHRPTKQNREEEKYSNAQANKEKHKRTEL